MEIRLMNRGHTRLFLKATLAIAVLFSVGRAFPAETVTNSPAFFTEKIQPILVEHCYKCHSSKAEKVKGGL